MEPETVISALSSVQNPLLDDVLHWTIKVGHDWAEDPAVWVYAVLKPESLKRKNKIRTLILEALRQWMPSNVTSYVRFKTPAQIVPA